MNGVDMSRQGDSAPEQDGRLCLREVDNVGVEPILG